MVDSLPNYLPLSESRALGQLKRSYRRGALALRTAPCERSRALIGRAPRPERLRLAKENILVHRLSRAKREAKKKGQNHKLPRAKREAKDKSLVHKLPRAKRGALTKRLVNRLPEGSEGLFRRVWFKNFLERSEKLRKRARSIN